MIRGWAGGLCDILEGSASRRRWTSSPRVNCFGLRSASVEFDGGNVSYSNGKMILRMRFNYYVENLEQPCNFGWTGACAMISFSKARKNGVRSKLRVEMPVNIVLICTSSKLHTPSKLSSPSSLHFWLNLLIFT